MTSPPKRAKTEDSSGGDAPALVDLLVRSAGPYDRSACKSVVCTCIPGPCGRVPEAWQRHIAAQRRMEDRLLAGVKAEKCGGVSGDDAPTTPTTEPDIKLVLSAGSVRARIVDPRYTREETVPKYFAHTRTATESAQDAYDVWVIKTRMAIAVWTWKHVNNEWW